VFDELSATLGAEIVLKMESMSDVGSFKWRGALNKMLSLPGEVAERGVVTYSTGNHGIAVAAWAKRLGIPCQVCVPSDVGAKKLERLRELAVQIDMESLDQEQAAKRCYELADQNAMTVIPPFDDPEVIAGQGTIGLEVLSQCPDVDVIVVPVSGGGLVSGIGIAVRASRPDVRIVGVCAEKAPTMFASVHGGRPVAVEESTTVADSLRGGLGTPNRYTFDLVRALGIEMVQVSEADIEAAMRMLLLKGGLLVEGAAAVGLAALIARGFDFGGKKVVLIVSGRNVDEDRILELVRG
jgi:threonine dehydratase